MGGSPKLLEAVGYSYRSGVGSVSDLVPGIGPADQLYLAILAYDRLPATAARRLFRLRTNDFVPHRGGIVINRAGVAFGIESWSRRRGIWILANCEGGAAARILNRFQVGTTHGFRHAFEGGFGVLTCSHLRDERDDRNGDQQCLPHESPPNQVSDWYI